MTDALARLKTALSDRYTLERELGQGGMATVYLAQDLKHDRQVAIKVLKPELAAVLGAERFVVEIKTTAALQHPHILPLFDSGVADGFLYYVMPFIQGETLRTKLDRETQLGIDEAVRIARDVADALDYAHRHGVIHRDIKPENILLHDGRPMVADFGIALALSAAAGGRMTETGMSLGTPHYMSPEQATAEKEISGRSDVYSLASVLYEMLTGEPPHMGKSAQQIIMKIIAEPVKPVTDLRKSVPPHVADAVAQALEKLPADRFTSAAEFAAALGGEGGTVTRRPTANRAASGPRAVRSSGLLTILAAALLLATGLAAWGWLRPSPEPAVTRQRVVLWSYHLPSPLDPGARMVANQVAIAPDGSSIVYADTADGTLMLWRKLRGAAAAVPMPDTEGGVAPFFSPDGRWVGFQTLDRKLRKIPVEGGGAVTLAENGSFNYKVGTWLDDQTIVYGVGLTEVARVSADGGEPVMLPMPGAASGVNLLSIVALPGSRGFLAALCDGNCAVNSAVYVYEFASDSARLVIPNASGVWYAPTGHLLFTDRERGLFAAPFDLGTLEVTGGSVSVIEGVEPTRFALSASGTAVYVVDRTAEAPSDLVWVARDGRVEPVDSTWKGWFEYPAISPDGRSVAVSLRGQTTDLWIRREDGTRQKLIAAGEAIWRPSWTPDGESLAFIAVTSERGADQARAFLARTDGVGTARQLLTHDFGVWEVELSRDGQWAVFRADEEGGANRIYARRLAGDTTVLPLHVDRMVGMGRVSLSPDGRWLAWSGTLGAGEGEIYVASFPDMGSLRQVSRGGGDAPRWSRSGRELFFENAGTLMTVAVPPGPTLAPGAPRPLFSLAGFRVARNRPQYDVAPGDQRFVMIREPGSAAREVVYVENWFTELTQRMRQ
ncbi:MAG: LpqB family beta-propeller domain-containing protein [Gemmatimonadales bacterium]